MSSETKFGWELILDLYECDPTAISNEKMIRRYATELCDLLGMKPYGDPITPYFGENQLHTKGYSLVQFIETSSIVGHFSEYKRTVYINIFSCKAYDEKHAERFTKAFFGAESVKSRFIVRE
ncbi:MAG: S-adenosylmethionine decarboxylase [Desulfobacterales bacterium]